MDSLEIERDIQLVTPFPLDHHGLLWGWLHEFPEQNFDDGGPRTLAEFTALILRWQMEGRDIYEVLYRGRSVGAVGMFVGPFCSRFSGVCFTREVHGKGIAIAAVRMVLKKTRTPRFEATYFADNIAIRKMFQKLGAIEVPCVAMPVLRHGKVVECATVVMSGVN